jgi:demethylmenaquinone methyltransferase/2-methoxy-6-polyprenyl-1,4-benzoquinol methylase
MRRLFGADSLRSDSAESARQAAALRRRLAEQVDYYRARAPEYDDWWERRHQYDFGPQFASAWAVEVAAVGDALDRFAPTGDVLELAAGTGIFTALLLAHAEHVTAVDASPEALAINAARNGTDRVEHAVADLFEWEPPRRFDHVCFSFWISHVPATRWAGFWAMGARALVPGGRVWFCDNARADHAIAHGPALLAGVGDTRRPDGVEDSARVLRDGRQFTIVKRYWSPPELEAELAGLGWSARCGTTTWAFLHGTAERAR